LLGVWPPSKAHSCLRAFDAHHLVRQFGFGTSAAGAVLALFGVGGLLYSRLARRGLRLLGERGLANAGGATLAFALLLLSWSSHWLATLPACLLAGSGFYMLHATLQTQATQMAPSRRGAAVAVCVLFIGQFIGASLSRWRRSKRVGLGVHCVGGGSVLLGIFVGRGVAPRSALEAAMP
jgi:predicted MFS family arabinose efflux permease